MASQNQESTKGKLENEAAALMPFIDSSIIDRFNYSYRSLKGRKKFITKINHENIFKENYRHMIPKSNTSPNKILELLKEKGAPPLCYVISNDPEIDGKEMLLEDAVYKIELMQKGAILCCISGYLLYYRNETTRRYIIEKK